MKLPIKFLIGVLAIIIGVSGAIVCLCTQGTEEEGYISEYVSAINDADLEKMATYGQGAFKEYEGLDEKDPIKAALAKSCFGAPDDAEKVNSVELVGCVIREQPQAEFYLELSSIDVKALIEMEYIDKDGDTVSKLLDYQVIMIKQNGQYVIVSSR